MSLSIELQAIRKVPIFDGLTEDQLRAVLGIVRRTRCPAGTVLLREGEIGQTMYVLVEGMVEITKRVTLRLSRTDFGEKTKTLARLDGADAPFFGEMAILEENERSATVTAVTPCELLEIQKGDFEQIAARDPLLGYRIVRNVARMLCARLRSSNRDVLKLTTALSLALARR
ncbi:MAG: cyclic nucleotide-binding domain-containing protein [Chloroflexi bacterium]|nr:cyclic nucleotide-binding domain-containing protein [Chloroflexota bacterium]